MASLWLYAPVWAKSHFHDVYAPEDNDGGEQSKHVLVEQWILEVVVVAGDEERKDDEEKRKQDSAISGCTVGEDGIEQNTSSVNHGQLVHELRGVWLTVSTGRAVHWTLGYTF